MRRIQAPGIELNEFDRSQYGSQSTPLEDAPYCFICGFSDKGDNYAVKYINSKQSLLQEFGQPQTEYEKYFYNGCLEIVSNGGVCLASRLPYDNASLDRYTYCDYTVSTTPQLIGNLLDVEEHSKTFRSIVEMIVNLVGTTSPWQQYRDQLLDGFSFSTVRGVVNAVEDLRRVYASETQASDEEFEEISEVQDIVSALKELMALAEKQNKEDFCYLRLLDSDLTSCLRIESDTAAYGTGKLTMKQLDDLKVGNVAAIKGKMRIVDISRSNYTSTSFPTVSSVIEDGCTSAVVETDDCLGIVPVVVSPVNALYFQEQLDLAKYYKQSGDDAVYNEVSELSTASSPFMDGAAPTLTVDLSQLQQEENLVVPLSSSSAYQPSLSRVAAQQFPSIIYKNAEHFDPTYLKCIGIAVFRAYRDDANSGQVAFQLLESFVGSLDKTAKDQSTGASTFIDKVVNQSSKYINVFSNVPSNVVQQASIMAASQNRATSLGFYQLDLAKKITLTTSINGALSKLLAKLENPNVFPLDLVIDAGVSNIAQNTMHQSLAILPSQVQTLDSFEDTKAWLQVVQKLDSFCKYTRKDCMLLADGLRSFCLANDVKIVRDTDPESSVQNDILPKLKYMSSINSSYAAGYCNWFLVRDEYSGDMFWCPPSIKAVASYIYCDTYCHPWSVPAGMSRGRVKNALDVAFQPTVEEAGKIYSQTWNYAVSYPADGIVIEGQKTFQKSYTALDRVNVRRLMLYLEKTVVRIARRFLYEGNTEYLRQQFVDAISPVFDDAQSNGGIVEYAIKCDNELNTPQVIDNNEMRCKIAVKPVKALEYLVLDFIVTNQTADVREEVRR